MDKRSEIRYYLAYGSNLNIAQMQHRCPDAHVVGTAELPGWRLMYKGSRSGNYLTIERAEGYTVPVAVWAVSERDERSLDRYEGFPTFYYKKTIKVVKTDEHGIRFGITQGMVYIMHENRKLGIPSSHYLETLDRAYLKFGFDENILGDAYEYSWPTD